MNGAAMYCCPLQKSCGVYDFAAALNGSVAGVATRVEADELAAGDAKGWDGAQLLARRALDAALAVSSLARTAQIRLHRTCQEGGGVRGGFVAASCIPCTKPSQGYTFQYGPPAAFDCLGACSPPSGTLLAAQALSCQRCSSLPFQPMCGPERDRESAAALTLQNGKHNTPHSCSYVWHVVGQQDGSCSPSCVERYPAGHREGAPYLWGNSRSQQAACIALGSPAAGSADTLASR